MKLPGIQLHVVEAPNHQLTRALLRGEIDFAIAAVPPDFTDENIRVTALVNDEICIVARAAHPIMKKKSPTQKELCEYDWALQERGGLIWRYFQALFANANLEPPVVTLTANSVQTLKSVVIVKRPDHHAAADFHSKRREEQDPAAHSCCVPPDGDGRLAVLRRSNGSMLPAVNLVLDGVPQDAD